MIPTLIAKSHHSPQKKKEREQTQHENQDQYTNHHLWYGNTFTRRKASKYITLIIVLGIMAISPVQRENKQYNTKFLSLGQQQSKTKEEADVLTTTTTTVTDFDKNNDKKEMKNNQYYGISKDLTYQEKVQVLQQKQLEVQFASGSSTTSTTTASSSSSSKRVSSSIFKTVDENDDNNTNEPLLLLDRFIVIPEYKLLFCYIDKVGCAMFNHVFRLLRLLSPQFQQSIKEELVLLQQQQQQQPKQEQKRFGKKKKQTNKKSSSTSYIEEVKYQMEKLWFRNTPQHHNLTLKDMEDIFQNPNWTKGLFYRDPVTRFLSGFRSKCINFEDINNKSIREYLLEKKKRKQEHGGNGSERDDISFGVTTNSCYQTFGTNNLQYLDDAIDILMKHPTMVFENVHFKPQVEFCGGSFGTSESLQYYDFVQQLRTAQPPPSPTTTTPNTSTTYGSPTTQHMKRLFEKIGRFAEGGGGGGGGDTIEEKKIQQHLLDTVEKGGIHDLQKDKLLVTTYLNLTNVRGGEEERKNPQSSSPGTTTSIGSKLEFEFEFHGGQQFAATKHNTNSNNHGSSSGKKSTLRTMFRNSDDTATIQRLLEQLQDMYRADYDIFQIPKLTIDQYDVAGV